MILLKGRSLLVAILPLIASSRAFCLDHLSPLTGRPGRRKNGHLASATRTAANRSIYLRGGSRTFTQREARKIAASHDGDFSDNITQDERWRRRGMSAALATTYLTVMGAKCALPSVLVLLTSKNGLTFPEASGRSAQGHMAALLGISTLAVASGKLLLGPLIDAVGGIRALQLSLTLLMGLMATISCTQQFSFFAISWILVDFIFSSCWASCINAIHQSFPEKSWGKEIGSLAVGARTGNALSFALFASILYRLETSVKQPWRYIFALSSLAQIIPISLLTYFGRKTFNNSDPATPTKAIQDSKFPASSSLKTLRTEASTVEFWLHLLSRSALMVFASFLLFVPTLMSKAYGASNSVAARGGSIYSLGCLLSVTFGSSWYSKLAKAKQALTCVVLTTMATMSSLSQLGHVSGSWTLTPAWGAASMFLWGFAFAIPFYLPPSLYALSRGGKQSSATIADMFDIGGFTLLAIFNGYVASIDHASPAAWIPTFVLTTACAVVSLVSLPFAILRQ